MSKCNRCGICCLMGCCSQGIEDENGICKYLVLNNDNTTSCQLVLDNKYNSNYITINKGCALKFDNSIGDKIYLEYKKMYENYKELLK